MTKKRITATLIATLMTLSILVGCSANELSYYKISNDLSNWQVNEAVSIDGEMALSINTVSEDLKAGAGANADMVDATIDYINNHKVVFTMESDVREGLSTGSFDIIQVDTGDVIPVMTVMRKDKVTYVKIDDYIAFIEKVVTDFTDEEYATNLQNGMTVMFGDVKYVKVTDDEIVDFYKTLLEGEFGSTEQLDTTFNQLKEQYTNPDVADRKRVLSKDLIDLLIEDVYDDFSLDIVEKDGKKYVMTLDADNFGNVLFNSAEYTLDNSEALTNALKTYLESISDEDFTLLFGSAAAMEMNKAMLAEQLDEAALDIEENREEYRGQLLEALNMYDTMYKAYIDGSIIENSLEQSDNTITSESYIEVNVNDPATGNVMFNASLNVTQKVEKIKSVDVDLPTENVYTFNELLEAMPTTIEISVPNQTYDLTYFSTGFNNEVGDMNVIIRDGRSYLPMRMIVEKLGGEVGWDDQLRKPFFVIDGETVYVEEYILVDSTSYIKTREFENVDYIIGWDPETRTISITK